MKVNILDAHDRYNHFTKQSFDIAECCQDLINKRPFGDYPFYIFAHARTEEDGATKRLIWQPRLTKPKAQTNSMLFKAYPGKDIVKIIWMIPAEELWPEYEKGKVAQNESIFYSIECYKKNRKKLEAKEHDDLDDEKINSIYQEICLKARREKTVEFPAASSMQPDTQPFQRVDGPPAV